MVQARQPLMVPRSQETMVAHSKDLSNDARMCNGFVAAVIRNQFSLPTKLAMYPQSTSQITTSTHPMYGWHLQPVSAVYASGCTFNNVYGNQVNIVVYSPTPVIIQFRRVLMYTTIGEAIAQSDQNPGPATHIIHRTIRSTRYHFY